MANTDYRLIVGYDGYRVGDTGVVQTCKKFRGNGYGRKPLYVLGDIWRDLGMSTDERGRRRVTLCCGGKARKFKVSQLVLEAFVGPRSGKQECCHENGDESDDRLENLRWDTHSANLLDRRRHGTVVNGEKINTAKLTEAAVRQIRSRRAVGEPLKSLAIAFKVTEANISSICCGRTWVHV